LGQMISQLHAQGIRIPDGFAVTAAAYWYYLEHNHFIKTMRQIMNQLSDYTDIALLKKVGHEIRSLLVDGNMPADLAQEIVKAYHELSQEYKQTACDVAVRSSATAEDLPTASFAGQQETYLNVRGDEQLLVSCKKSMASLFTDRAIVYRIEQGFDHFDVALSVGVQKMIRSDLASAGVIFSLDTESGFKEVVLIESSWGLGEAIVKGLVIPDEFMVFKPTLAQNFKPIIKKQLGTKTAKIIYANSDTKTVPVPRAEQEQFSLTDDEILELARITVIIEDHYSALKNKWSPMDIEWAKDGIDGKIYVIQARPETVHAVKKETVLQQYVLKDGFQAHEKQLLLTGLSIGQQIVSGKVRIIEDVRDSGQVQEGDIIVTGMTDPDWVPVMKKAAGIVTDRGGRTCHAAIVSRELGITAIVGTHDATKKIEDKQVVTLDCSRGNVGFIYEGTIPFVVQDIRLTEIPTIPVALMVNIADPDSAFQVSFLPTAGVGLARLEFIITYSIKIHPLALIHPDRIKDKKVLQEIEMSTAAYPNKADFFVDRLAQGISMIAAAFYPRTVIVRLSDFKSNEYRNLIGGIYFEPEEENPMLGFRGASRYCHERYKEAFALECAALKKVRDTMGLTNVRIMVPFVRTVKEAVGVLREMKNNGLEKGVNGLQVVMMSEVPSNVLLVDEFSKLFDGFSIGSNDLTQLTLGVDRDSELLADIFDERDEAVKKIMKLAIEGAHRNGRYIGICGQAPSDYPEIAQFVISCGIDSISLNPDSVLPFLMRYAKK
ncbi:MAG TPA: phosphoenolpyruvate synthase, partial [Candidatus Dependentiae bacterium]|nr:phosphoenolpyruvate synthase [Candidatus Dependentiae bacterium]